MYQSLNAKIPSWNVNICQRLTYCHWQTNIIHDQSDGLRSSLQCICHRWERSFHPFHVFFPEQIPLCIVFHWPSSYHLLIWNVHEGKNSIILKFMKDQSLASICITYLSHVSDRFHIVQNRCHYFCTLLLLGLASGLRTIVRHNLNKGRLQGTPLNHFHEGMA